jgi:hypothetical protein
LDEIIKLKDVWAQEENKRAMVTKVEVDAMKENWAEKEKKLLELYQSRAKELKTVQKEMDDLRKKGRGRGGRGGEEGEGGSSDPALAKHHAKLVAQAKQATARLEAIQAKNEELEERYDEVVEKCARTMWQLRQDHGELVRMKREKIETDIELGKQKVKMELQKRVRDAGI